MSKPQKISDYKASEKWLESTLVKEVKARGGHALKFASNTEAGYPDRLVMMPGGKVYWVELKSKGKKARLLQQIRHQELIALGFQVFVISNETELNNFLAII